MIFPIEILQEIANKCKYNTFKKIKQCSKYVYTNLQQYYFDSEYIYIGYENKRKGRKNNKQVNLNSMKYAYFNFQQFNCRIWQTSFFTNNVRNYSNQLKENIIKYIDLNNSSMRHLFDCFAHHHINDIIHVDDTIFYKNDNIWKKCASSKRNILVKNLVWFLDKYYDMYLHLFYFLKNNNSTCKTFEEQFIKSSSHLFTIMTVKNGYKNSQHKFTIDIITHLKEILPLNHIKFNNYEANHIVKNNILLNLDTKKETEICGKIYLTYKLNGYKCEGYFQEDNSRPYKLFESIFADVNECNIFKKHIYDFLCKKPVGPIYIMYNKKDVLNRHNKIFIADLILFTFGKYVRYITLNPRKTSKIKTLNDIIIQIEECAHIKFFMSNYNVSRNSLEFHKSDIFLKQINC